MPNNPKLYRQLFQILLMVSVVLLTSCRVMIVGDDRHDNGRRPHEGRGEKHKTSLLLQLHSPETPGQYDRI